MVNQAQIAQEQKEALKTNVPAAQTGPLPKWYVIHIQTS